VLWFHLGQKKSSDSFRDVGVLKTAVLCMRKWQWTVVVCYIKLTLCHFFNNATLLGSVRWLGCGLGDRSLSFEAQKRKGRFCLSESVERSIFESKILRRVYGPLGEGGTSRKGYRRELEEPYDEPIIGNVIKSSRLRWAVHVVRIDDKELPKKILWTNPGGHRGRGRP